MGVNEMDVFGELIKHEPDLLSRPIEELGPISFIGQAAVTAYRGLVGKLDSLPMSEEQKRKTLADGQQAGRMLLAIEGRIGELYAAMPRRTKTTDASSTVYREAVGGDSHSKGYKEAERAQAIHRNPDAVAAVIKEAEENEDIPTKTAVLNKVRYNKEVERRKKAEAHGKTKIEITLDQQQYINTLERVIGLLPKEPPKDWKSEAFDRAKALANIIIRRLEVFNGNERISE